MELMSYIQLKGFKLWSNRHTKLLFLDLIGTIAITTALFVIKGSSRERPHSEREHLNTQGIKRGTWLWKEKIRIKLQLNIQLSLHL